MDATSSCILQEGFNGTNWDNRLRWQNEPKTFSITHDGLEVYPDVESDNWCRTHYDWGVHDSAHFLAISIPDDDKIVEITTRVQLFQKDLYDQAGLMIRRGPDSWIKCSTEFGKNIDSPARLGSVVTNNGYSDWATQDYRVSEGCYLSFRIVKYHTNDVCIQYREDDNEEWKQLRIAHLFPLTDSQTSDTDKGHILVGIYCCAPISYGFKTIFRYLNVTYLSETPTD